MSESINPHFSVFNGHVNNADKRARNVMKKDFHPWYERLLEIEEEHNGIMGIFNTDPEPATAAYVALVTAFVNQGKYDD